MRIGAARLEDHEVVTDLAVGFGTIATGFGLEYGWAAELEDL